MEKDHYLESKIEFFEREVDLYHAFLDITGPKHIPALIADARRGCQNVLDWIGTVNDPTRLARLSTKLNRLKECLLAGSSDRPSGGKALGAKAAYS
jgi:hypothetical protein